MPEEKTSPKIKNDAKIRRTVLAVYFVTLFATIVWLALIVWAPHLRSHSSPWQRFIYAVFSPVCHQIPSRCFFIFGNPLAVCARCLGIYLGFLAGVGLYPLLRGFRRLDLPKAKIFCLISSPIVVDTVGNFAGLWETSKGIRLGIGFLWGAILPIYFMTGITELILSRKTKKTT